MPDDGQPRPAAPQPDAKDWTWVTERTCPDCWFEAGAVEPTDVAQLLRDNVAEWAEILAGDRAAVTARPRPTTWSAAEYAAHVRDVCAIYDERLALMLAEDGPHYANWDQDATAIEERYDLQDPGEISTALQANAARLADRFDTVTDADWDRTGHRGDGAVFTIRTFAQYFIHDPIHHLHDVMAGLVAVMARTPKASGQQA